jgi:transposase
VKGFQVLPRQWVVERTFGWLTRCRRPAREYGRKTIHGEAVVKFAMIRLMPPSWPARNSRTPQ